MPLISFEKYLREVEDVVIQGKQRRLVELRVRGGACVWASWTDDHVFSITGAVVHSLRGIFTAGSRFESSPLVQIVHSSGVLDMLGGISIAEYVEYLRAGGSEHHDQHNVDTVYDYHATLVNPDTELTPAQQYSTANALHSMAVSERLVAILS